MDAVSQDGKLAYVTSGLKCQGFLVCLLLIFKHHSGYTPLFVDSRLGPGASQFIFPAPSAALSAFIHQRGLQGCSRLTLQRPSRSRVGAGSFLDFPSLPISFLLPSLPPVLSAPSLVLNFHMLQSTGFPHPGIPKRIPPPPPGYCAPTSVNWLPVVCRLPCCCTKNPA